MSAVWDCTEVAVTVSPSTVAITRTVSPTATPDTSTSDPMTYVAANPSVLVTDSDPASTAVTEPVCNRSVWVLPSCVCITNSPCNAPARAMAPPRPPNPPGMPVPDPPAVAPSPACPPGPNPD